MRQELSIIFDFGGVLLDWNPERVYRPYFQDESEMQRFFRETEIMWHNRELDRGRPFDQVLRELKLRYLQYSEALGLWKTSWAKMLGGPIEGSIALLSELYQNQYRLYGLTNWAAETFPYVYYTYDFFQLFTDIVVSGREGLIKPEAEIFQLCLQRNDLLPSSCVFIDDNLENVGVARQLGIKGIHFQSSAQVRQELKDLGLALS